MDGGCADGDVGGPGKPEMGQAAMAKITDFRDTPGFYVPSSRTTKTMKL